MHFCSNFRFSVFLLHKSHLMYFCFGNRAFTAFCSKKCDHDAKPGSTEHLPSPPGLIAPVLRSARLLLSGVLGGEVSIMGGAVLKLPSIKIEVPRPRLWDLVTGVVLVIGCVLCVMNWMAAQGKAPGTSLSSDLTLRFVLLQLAVQLIELG